MKTIGAMLLDAREQMNADFRPSDRAGDKPALPADASADATRDAWTRYFEEQRLGVEAAIESLLEWMAAHEADLAAAGVWPDGPGLVAEALIRAHAEIRGL